MKIKDILYSIYGKIQKKFTLGAVASNNAYLIKKGILKIGIGTYGIYNLQVVLYTGCSPKIEIGKYCSIASGVRIVAGGNHPVDWVSTFPFRVYFDLPGKFNDGMPSSNGDIIIGNDVWIGTGVTILSGVKIGDGSVIAANALVTKDISPYSIVGGIPAKTIKKRFSDEKIVQLLSIKWWDWDESKIKECVDLLSSDKIDAFLLSLNR